MSNRMSDPKNIPLATDTHYAAVICRGDSVPGQSRCGQVPLSESEYERQLSRPDSVWMCPRCGSTADFDDDYYEDHHGIADEEPPEPDGEAFRGDEYAGWLAAEQAEARKLK